MDERSVDAAALIAVQPALGPDARSVDRIRRLCVAAGGALHARGVGVSVMGDGAVRGLVAASDEPTERLEELQFTMGEGPCVDAFDRRRPVLVPEFDATVMARWPAYAPAVHDLGVRAVFAFPLQVGAARLGVLDVFRDVPRMLSDVELGLAFAFADAAMAMLLNETISPDGDDGLNDTLGGRAEVFQAQGMLTGQLGVTLAEALVRMRAHAFAEGRRLAEVAADILAGRLHL